MREYFRPIRRKFGILVLVVACGVMGLWVRSFVPMDQIQLDREYVNKPYGALYIQAIDGVVECVWDTRSVLMNDLDRPKPVVYWSVPFSVVVLPLTVISAWLLIKPRPKLTQRVPHA